MNIKLFFKILNVLLDSIVFRTFKTCPDVELESISTNFSAYIIQDCKMSNGPQKRERWTLLQDFAFTSTCTTTRNIILKSLTTCRPSYPEGFTLLAMGHSWAKFLVSSGPGVEPKKLLSGT